MATTTFCRSNSANDSYSMFTNDSPPDIEGQQLMDRGTRLSSLVCAVPQFFLSCLHTAFLACACSILDAFLALTTLRILHVASTPCAFLGGPNKGAQMLYQIRLGSRLARLTWQRQGYNLKPGASLYCWGHLHAPFEDWKGRAGGEGAVGILEAQHILRVQRLVDVGVRLELVPLICPRLNHHPHPRMCLVQHLPCSTLAPSLSLQAHMWPPT